MNGSIGIQYCQAHNLETLELYAPNAVSDLGILLDVYPFTQATLCRLFRDGCIIVFAMLGDVIVGVGSLRPLFGAYFIENLSVSPVFRNANIARKIVSTLVADVRIFSNEKKVTLHCEGSNRAAKNLYVSLGFRCVKVHEEIEVYQLDLERFVLPLGAFDPWLVHAVSPRS